MTDKNDWIWYLCSSVSLIIMVVASIEGIKLSNENRICESFKDLKKHQCNVTKIEHSNNGYYVFIRQDNYIYTNICLDSLTVGDITLKANSSYDCWSNGDGIFYFQEQGANCDMVLLWLIVAIIFAVLNGAFCLLVFIAKCGNTEYRYV